MSQPKFEVGEIVVLQSVKHPECNGEYEILEILAPGGYVEIVGVNCVNDRGVHGYRLPPLYSGDFGWWLESALRKRHQPGEYSFDALKQILALPVSREDLA